MISTINPLGVAFYRLLILLYVLSKKYFINHNIEIPFVMPKHLKQWR